MSRNKIYIVSLALFLMASSAFSQEIKQEFATKETVKVELYPNPAIDYLTIQINEGSLQNVKFELRSIIGNQLYIQPESIGTDMYRIHLKEFASGYYFLVIRDEGTQFKKAFKFLKQ